MAWQDWLGIKTDKDITEEEKKAAYKRTMERAKKGGMKYEEEMKTEEEMDRPGRPHFTPPKKRY